MKDIQKELDTRNIPVDQVGVSGIQYPITIKDKLMGQQDTVAMIDMMVDLNPSFKGTHMSRFIEILNRVRGEITMANIPEILEDMKRELESSKATISLRFPYFIEKEAPHSKAKSLFSVDVLFSGYSSKEHGTHFILGVRTPVTTLCPCSKEISKYGAHNQRSLVALYVSFHDFIWIEDLVSLIESCASCEIYPLLKRRDEKAVTEKAYENPQFAEDMVRSITEKMSDSENIRWFLSETVHLESIHTHNAYARIERFQEDSTVIREHLQVFKGFPIV